MPAPIPNEMRRQIVKRHEAGETLASISEDLSLSYNTVRKIWTHWGKHGKLSPNYEQAKQTGTRQYQAVYEQALEMKRDHALWGGELIRLELARQFPDSELPSTRTLQRWFKQAGVNRPVKVKHACSLVVKRGQEVHEVWAVDAKEQMRLSDGSYACWLMVTDEGSGSVLGCETFSPEVLDPNQCITGSSEFTDDV